MSSVWTGELKTMFVVNELIERKKKDGSKLYFDFIDIEKAYDRMNREMLVTDGLSPAAKCARCVTWERMRWWSMWCWSVKYGRDRYEMMQVVLRELGHEWR